MLKIHNGVAGDIALEHVGSNAADKSVSVRVSVNGMPVSMILLAADGPVLRADPLPSQDAKLLDN